MSRLRLVISAPSGFNSREILLPLRTLLTNDDDIEAVLVISPAANYRAELFPNFGEKFEFVTNPRDDAGHRELIGRFRPDVVITPTFGLDINDTPIIRAAKYGGIPVVVFIASWDNVFKMERLKKHGHSGTAKKLGRNYALPDYFAVWNQLNSDHLRRVWPEIPESRVRITGSPRFDYFSHDAKIPTKSELLSYLGFKPDPEIKLIHGATTELYPFNYIWKVIAHARAASQIKAPLNLYASVHPGGDLSKHNYEKYGIVTKYSFGRRAKVLHPDFTYLPQDTEVYMLVALFRHSDILINQSSTVAIESMRADTPVINVKFGQPFDFWHWRRSMVYRDFREHYRYVTEGGGTTIAHNPKELVAAINQALSAPRDRQIQRRSSAATLLTFTDGSSGRRLLALAKEIALK